MNEVLVFNANLEHYRDISLSARKCRITHDSVCRPQAGHFISVVGICVLLFTGPITESHTDCRDSRLLHKSEPSAR